MNRTIVLKPFVNNNDMACIWPDSASMYNTSIEVLPKAHELLRMKKFAEREFGSTKGVGSGPFFSASFVPHGASPKTYINGEAIRTCDMYGTQTYKVGSLDCYMRFSPSVRDNQRIIAWAYVYMDNGRWYNNELGYIPLDDHLINAADSFGYVASWSGNDWGPYPDPSFENSPEAVLSWLLNLVPTHNMRGLSTIMWYRAEFEYGKVENVPVTDIPLLYGEHSYYLARSHPELSSPFGQYGNLHPGLFSSAYYKAQDKLPQLLSNTFQNLLEAGQLVASLANGIDLSDLKSLRNLAGNAWLAYRYQYNTTVSDLEELESAIERFDNLSRAKGRITSYGYDADPTGSYHCALSIDPQQILNRSLLKRLNLRPTLANAWDMIPYSFIVDWFTNIGDVLAAIDKWLDAPSYGAVKCWYSLTNTYQTDNGVVTVFFRVGGGQPLLPYWSMDYSTDSKVWAMRATDVVSLLL